MNIESLGEGKIEILFDNNLIKDYSDLYNLTYDKIFGLEKIIIIDDDNLENTTRKVSFKEKTANNIIDAIEKSKSVPFARVLFALGIKYVGETTAKLIAKAMGSIDNIINASVEDLMEIEEVGEKIALSIKDFFADERNIHIVNRLKNAGLQFEHEKKEIGRNQVLSGMNIVVSGVFSTMSRDEIKQLIEDLGGKNVSSISSKTTFVLAGDKMGPEKKKKAESLGIEIKSEKDFLRMINNDIDDNNDDNNDIDNDIDIDIDDDIDDDNDIDDDIDIDNDFDDDDDNDIDDDSDDDNDDDNDDDEVKTEQDNIIKMDFEIDDDSDDDSNKDSGIRSYIKTPTPTIGERLESSEDNSLASMLQKKSISDLTTAIDLNDRFMFLNELFDSNMEKYNKAIKTLNSFATLLGAKTYMSELQIELQWNCESDAYKKLNDLVERRFI